MKIRTGFVSNSSSSSFVLAVGKVLDRPAFEEYMKGIDLGLYTSVEAEQIKDWSTYNSNGYFCTEGFTGASARVKIEPDSLYFCTYESRDLMEDIDGTVWDDDYTVAQQKIFALPNMPFVEKVDVAEGYGRNG